MKWDYLIIVILFIVVVIVARYLTWRDLRKLGSGSFSTQVKGGDHDSGIYHRRTDNAGIVIVFDLRVAQTGKVLKSKPDTL